MTNQTHAIHAITLGQQPSGLKDDTAFLGQRDVFSTHAIALPWIMRLRWFAFWVQLLGVVIFSYFFGFSFNIAPVLTVISLLGVTNVALRFYIHKHSVPLKHLPLYLVVFDNVLLTALFYYTGGPNNPFTVLYIVHVVMAVVALRPIWVWVVCLISLLGYGLLFFHHIPLGTPDAMAHHHHGGDQQGHANWHLWGMWLALGIAMVLTAYFIGKVLRALQDREKKLSAMKAVAQQNARLASLTTLAAGCAHELSTPLGTIAVVSKELQRALEKSQIDDQTESDLKLIGAEVQRCRAILDLMCANLATQSQKDNDIGSMTALIEMVGNCLGSDNLGVLQIKMNPNTILPALPLQPLTHLLVAIIKNGIDASNSGEKVHLSASQSNQWFIFTIQDFGSGISQEDISRIGEPFFTTKAPGKGMGLGLYLAQATVTSLGGSITFESQCDAGTTVSIMLPKMTPHNGSSDA